MELPAAMDRRLVLGAPIVRTPIPAARQAQGLAGALALAGAGAGAFGDEVGQVAGGGRPGLGWNCPNEEVTRRWLPIPCAV